MKANENNLTKESKMKTNRPKTQKELSQKYFNIDGIKGVDDIYGKDNFGIVSLLSDVQHAGITEYTNEILNDIKVIS